MTDHRLRTVTVAPDDPTVRAPSAGRRAGYVIAVVCNGVMLWLAHQLLDWGWPGFLTDDFETVLPWLSFSFVASMIVDVCFVYRDRGWFRSLADVITATIGLVVSVRVWTVFPFDFSGHEHDWSWLFRLGLVVGIVGSAIGMLANGVKLIGQIAARDSA